MRKVVNILFLIVIIADSCGGHGQPTTSQADSLNIRQEQIDNDPLRLSEEQEKQSEREFYPLVSAAEVAMIAPVIKKWADFYGIDFAQARLVSKDSVCFNCSPDMTSIYYREFTKKCDTDKRIDVDYSPDKQRYVDLGISVGTYYNEEDKKYYFIGWDDCQEIYLIDRKQKHQNLIIWLGVSSLAEAVFWKSNDVFMVVGYDKNYSDENLHFVYVFDIKNNIQYRYEISTDAKNGYDRYMDEVYLKEKNIFVSN